MIKLIARYFIIQLLFGLFFYLLILNIAGYINQIDDFSKGRLFVLSIIGGLIFTFFNALINALNFTFIKFQNTFLAFYLPVLIWLVPLIISFTENINNTHTKITDWLFVLILVEPIAYNLILKKVINTSKS